MKVAKQQPNPKYKNVKIDEVLHGKLRIYVAKSGFKLKEFVSAAIVEKMKS